MAANEPPLDLVRVVVEAVLPVEAAGVRRAAKPVQVLGERSVYRGAKEPNLRLALAEITCQSTDEVGRPGLHDVHKRLAASVEDVRFLFSGECAE